MGMSHVLSSPISIIATTDCQRSAVPIPDFQTLMRPVLDLHGDGGDHDSAAVVAAMADRFELSAEERAEMLPLGRAEAVLQPGRLVTWSISRPSAMPPTGRCSVA